MESKDELKEIDIKNHMCYYFDDIMRVRDIDFSDILIDKKTYKTYKNILIYDLSHKPFMGAKPMHRRFNELDGLIKIYDRIRYLVLFVSERYNQIYDGIRYLISK